MTTILQDLREPDHQPLFSVIIPVFNTAEYLPTMIDSVAGQKGIKRDSIEIIVVDDGSTDESAKILQEWATSDDRVVLVSQENQGAAAARNEALDHARGQWVTFLDSDDFFSTRYFARAQKFIRDHADSNVALFVSKLLVATESDGRIRDNHPLTYRFANGSQVVDLEDNPRWFHMGANAFLKKSVIETHHLRYSTHIRPAFEDGHLVGRYLGTFDHPRIGFVAEAQYFYRKRETGQSLIQSGWADPRKYDDQILGYIDLCQRLEASQGAVPSWALATVLYDLNAYVLVGQQAEGPWTQLEPTQQDVLHQRLAELSQYLAVTELSHLMPDHADTKALLALATGYQRGSVGFRLIKEEGSTLKQLVQGQYAPAEQLQISDQVGSQKIRGVQDITIFGQNLAQIIDLPPSAKLKDFETATGQILQEAEASTFSPRTAAGGVDSVSQVLSHARASKVLTGSYPARSVARQLAGRIKRATVGQKVSPAVRQTNKLLKRSPKRYKDAWLILDRPQHADDSGEHLYRFIQRNHPEINAFFVLNRNSEDWDRLAEEGFRLLPYGQPETFAATQQAQFVLSSDATAECMVLAPRKLFGEPKYRFIFLQHGVLINDLSEWLNPKKIDLLIASHTREYQQLVWKESNYRFTADQVALTGLARFDTLVKLRDSAKSSDKAVLTLMPTWDRTLRDQLDAAASLEEQRQLVTASSLRPWIDLTKSDTLRNWVLSGEMAIEFVLHPSLERFSEAFVFPNHVRVRKATELSFQKLIAETDHFITDYSSVATDMAIAYRNVAYWQQPDSTSTHTWSQTSFDYETEGFGEVVTELDQVVEWIEKNLGSAMHPEYVHRVNAYIPTADGHSRQRIVEVIKMLAETHETKAAFVASPQAQRLLPTFIETLDLM